MPPNMDRPGRPRWLTRDARRDVSPGGRDMSVRMDPLDVGTVGARHMSRSHSTLVRQAGQARSLSATKPSKAKGASRRPAVGRKQLRSCWAACRAFPPPLAIAFPPMVCPPVPRQGCHPAVASGEAGFDHASMPLTCAFAAVCTTGRSRSSARCVHHQRLRHGIAQGPRAPRILAQMRASGDGRKRPADRSVAPYLRGKAPMAHLSGDIRRPSRLAPRGKRRTLQRCAEQAPSLRTKIRGGRQDGWTKGSEGTRNCPGDSFARERNPQQTSTGTTPICALSPCPLRITDSGPAMLPASLAP